MPKPRTKRGAARNETKRKRQHGADGEEDELAHRKRQRNTNGDGAAFDGDNETSAPAAFTGEKEFFGLLSDEEQEYFRRADELLELNQFPSTEDRDIFLQSIYHEAQGKELKLASSQSCSRLMERLIQLSSTTQKKRLFEAFAGHFLSLVQHRFASHCCEALFLRSAAVVSEELAGFVGFVLDAKGADVLQQRPEASMEDLFLATLDELEGHLAYLVTDRFASHTLRVLLVVLSGRRLEDASTRTLLKSKRKEKVVVAGAGGHTDEADKSARAIPCSFSAAVEKIIQDCTAELDAAGLRVLSKHPIGNPTLQLLLELDLEQGKGGKQDNNGRPSLLLQLLPGAPHSLSDPSSDASEFVNGMVYDPIGSRLVETIITHGPAKVFRALKHNIFLPRIQGYVRNDVASYAGIRVLLRLGKDDLVEAVQKIVPDVPQLVVKARFNVLRTLFERCAARGVVAEARGLMKGLKEGCGPETSDLVNTLCRLKEVEDKVKADVEQLSRNDYAIQSHGAQLLATLLSIPGGPRKAVQEALLSLPPDSILQLATTSLPTATVLRTALTAPSDNPAFHKSLVNMLSPHIPSLATSQFGHNVVVAISEIPSRGKELSVPPHMKEAVMEALGSHEEELRGCWMGRSVWRAWKGDTWKTRRSDWKVWMKNVAAPVDSGRRGHKDHMNGMIDARDNGKTGGKDQKEKEKNQKKTTSKTARRDDE